MSRDNEAGAGRGGLNTIYYLSSSFSYVGICVYVYISDLVDLYLSWAIVTMVS